CASGWRQLDFDYW
nr:immunoglobulin heavy chain junction region [Macaca mulatta]